MAVLGKYIQVYLDIFPLNICSETSCQFVQSLFDSADAICFYDHSLRKWLLFSAQRLKKGFFLC